MIKGSFANIIIDISHESVDRTFQYRIPETLLGKIQPGMCVSVPFGKGDKERTGYVVEVTDKQEYAFDKLKYISAVLEKNVSAESRQIRLAAWIKEQYGSTMIGALKTVLPVKQKTKTLQKRYLQLLLSTEEAKWQLAEYGRKKQHARYRLLERLLQEKSISYECATGELAVSSAVIKALAEKEILEVISEDIYRNPVQQKAEIRKKVLLSDEQSHIITDIMKDFYHGTPGTYLIHGITGSGKTEVYMELIAGMLAMKKQAIVLIPEIALTYQTVSRFTNRFGDRVSVMHSKLSPGERYDQCVRAKKGEIDIIIGPRSALFVPFERLGLIIIDEEHETSYKSESMPKYHAREVAKQLASYCNAGLVLGSATPSLEAYYASERGGMKRYELTKRLTGGTLPKVYVEDLREELRSGNRSIFSRRLQEMLQSRLEKGEQSMLFLNRRGYAGFVSCRACGEVMKCPHCDVSLSEHKNGRLVCHYCGYEQPGVTKCPKCGSKYILGFRAGTEQIEEVLHKMYPGVRVLRMDADTTRKKGSYDRLLEAFAKGEADILVGTQMIVKGHDFPNVTLVGILAADLSLHAGDYRAAERTFQLLTQAAGRAGRGEKAGEVVIQTYQPEHHSVQYAAAQDYQGFYREEMGYRELLEYPPVSHMLAVLILSEKEDAGIKLAGELAEKVKVCAQVIGPAAASIGKIGDLYRSIFYVKSKDMQVILEIKEQLESVWEREKKPGMLMQLDLDPMTGY